MTILEQKVDEPAPTRPPSRTRRVAAAGLRAVRSGPRKARRLVAGTVSPRRRLAVLVVVAVVLAGLLGALLWSVDQDTRSAAAGEEASRVASQQVVALLSYDFRTARQDLPPVLESLTGPFRDEYGRLLNDVVIPAAEQQQVTTRTSLAGSAVMSATPSHVELLMFLNQTSVTPAQPQPQLAGSRAKVTLELVDGQWKVSGLVPM